jgi:ATP-dependent Clp protease ATP-binding subunit ClpA
MFERFTDEARQVVVQAQQEGRALGHGWVGTEHLLLAYLHQDPPAAAALRPLGLTYDGVHGAVATLTATTAEEADAALRDLGIDVDEVRRRVEASFGPGALDDQDRRPAWGLRGRRRRGRGGHIPFTAEAKKALELALREALRLSAKEISAEHVVLGIVRGGGSATVVMTRLGVRPDAVRSAVLSQLGRAA